MPRPLANRVFPDGSLHATPARGLLMGNRGGRFHDAATQRLEGRTHATRQWICCVLSFKGRRRQVWAQGYTELFFCDEVTALAAGHRPCMECRRADAMAFRRALARTRGEAAPMPCPELDRLLDAERRIGRAKRLHRLPAETLPDGAMILDADGVFLALRRGGARAWSEQGYGAPRPRPTGVVEVLTPPTILAALAGGYTPWWRDETGALAREGTEG